MKTGMKIALGLFVLGVAVLLVQLWFTVWSAEVFIKLMITLGALLAVALVVTFVNNEARDLNRLDDPDR